MREQKIPFFKAMLMGVNVMVGAGMLAGPGPMAAAAGNASFLGWALVAMIMFPMVYSAARLAGMVQGAGGLYSYCKQAFGETIGFFSGWLYLISYVMASTSLLSAYRDYLKVTFPSVSLFASPTMFFLVALAGVCALNLLRVIVISSVQSYLTLVKITPVVVAIALLPFFFDSGFSVPMVDLASIPYTFTFAIFGYMGFEFCCNLSHLVEGGAESAKKAVLFGFAGVVVLYMLFHFSVLQIMGAENLAVYLAGGFPQFVVSKFAALGSFLIVLVSATTVLTYFNSANGLVFLCTSVMHSLSSDKKLRFHEFWNRLTANARPSNVLFAIALVVLIVGSLVTSTQYLMSSCNFGLAVMMMMVMFSLLKLDKTPTSFSRAIPCAGLIFSVGLLGYHFSQAGSCLSERMLSLSPLVVGMIIGVLLRQSGDDETSVHREPVNVEQQTIVKEAVMEEADKEEKRNKGE